MRTGMYSPPRPKRICTKLQGVVLGLSLLLIPKVSAEISLDGFTATDLTDDVVLNADGAGVFSITETLGQRPLSNPNDPNSAAPNLFHSFFRFELDAGQTALFTQAINDGTDPISNVIARVSGGLPSTINGTLTSQISGADFWFINPAGLMFGADASIDVGGSFNASAGDYLVLGADTRFSALDEVPNLTVSNPTSFGFLDTGGGSGALTLNGVFLGGPQDRGAQDRFANLHLHGHRVEIDAESGVGSDANRSATGNIHLVAREQINLLGDVRTRGQDSIPAGNIVLNGGTVDIDGGTLNSRARGQAAAGDITVRGDRVELSNAALIATFTSNPGAAGDIEITADEIVANAPAMGATTSPSEEIVLRTDSFNNGRQSGSIALNAASIDLRNTRLSSTGSRNNSNPHAITLTGETILLTEATVDSHTDGAAPAGDIAIAGSQQVAITDSAIISTTLSTGDAGQIDISGGDIAITGRREIRSGDGSLVGNGVDASTLARIPDGGMGGDIQIDATNIDVSEGARIRSFAVGGGDAGDLLLTASQSITGNRAFRDTQIDDRVLISSENGSRGSLEEAAVQGSSGNLTLTAGEDIDIVGTTLRAIARSDNPANSPSLVRLEAPNGTIRLDQGRINNGTRGGNDAGTVVLQAANIQLDPGSVVNAFSTGTGSSGSVMIEATQSIEGTGTFIATEAARERSGAAGEIDIHSAGPINLRNSQVVAATQSGRLVTNPETNEAIRPGIRITSDSDITLTDSTVVASTLGIAPAGDVLIQADNLLIEGQTIARSGQGGAELGFGVSASTLSEEEDSGDAGFVRLLATGDITLQKEAAVTSTTAGGGNSGGVVIEADRFLVNPIEADQIGANRVEIASRNTLRNGGLNQRGASGSIRITAETLIDVNRLTLNATRQSSNVQTADSPSEILVEVNNGRIITNRLEVVNATRGRNDGGNTTVRARDIELGENTLFRSFATRPGSSGTVSVIAENSLVARGISADVEARQSASGSAGSIEFMSGGNLVLRDSTLIASTQGLSATDTAPSIVVQGLERAVIVDSAVVVSTAGVDSAGSVLVSGDIVRIRGAKDAVSSSNNSTIFLGRGISASSLSTAEDAGDAGDVRVIGRDVRLTNEAQLSSFTEGFGSGGAVRVEGTETLTFVDSGILAATFGAGDAGIIDLRGELVDIRGATNFERADLARLLDQPINGFVASSFSLQRDAGDAGGLLITAGDIVLSDNANFSSRNFGGGNAGDLTLNATRTVTANLGEPDNDAVTFSSSNFNQPTLGRARLGLSGSVFINAGAGINLDNVEVRTVRRSSNADGRSNPSLIAINAGSGDLLLDRFFVSNETRGNNDGGLTSLRGNNITLTGRRNASGGFKDGLIRSFSTQSGNAGSVEIIANNNIELDNYRIDAEARQSSKGGAGSVQLVAGGTVQLTESAVVASTQVRNLVEDIVPGGVTVEGDSVFIDDSAVVASTAGGNDAGDILIRGTRVRVRGAEEVASSSNNSGILLGSGLSVSTLSENANAGNAGTLSVVADTIEIQDGARLTSVTRGSGAAGAVELRGATLDLQNDALVSSLTSGAGNGGTITLTASDGLTMLDSRLEVESVNAVAGAAGGIQLNAGGPVNLERSEIVAATQSDRRIEAEGQELRSDIQIASPELITIADSAIVASTLGNSNAGDISIRSDQAIRVAGARNALSGGGLDAGTGIEASANSTGNAGKISFIAPSVQFSTARISSQSKQSGSAGQVSITGVDVRLLEGSEILATTEGDGQGGAVLVTAETLELSDPGTRISSNARGAGAGGRVAFNLTNLIVQNGAVAETSAIGTGESGSIEVDAIGDVLLTANASDDLSSQSSLRTNSLQSQGGQISVGVGGQLRLVNSRITSSVQQSDGDGGRISVEPQALFLQSSQILAQANAGRGGNIEINRGVDDNGGLFLIDSASSINAQAQSGVDGDIRVDSPDINANAVVILKDARIADTPKLNENLCESARDDRSSLVIVPDKYVRPAPDGYLSARISETDALELASDEYKADLQSMYAALPLESVGGCVL